MAGGDWLVVVCGAVAARRRGGDESWANAEVAQASNTAQLVFRKQQRKIMETSLGLKHRRVGFVAAGCDEPHPPETKCGHRCL